MSKKPFVFIAVIMIIVFLLAIISVRKNKKTEDSPPAGQSQDLGPGDHEFSLTHDGLKRKYKVHAPPDYDRSKKTPLVIYVHGGGGDLQTAYNDGLGKMADEHGFLLAVPQGSYEEIDRFGKKRYSWNGGRWASGQCCGNADDVGFVSAMIDEINTSFNLDKKMVYATGISNGGLMTNRLGCELADKIAAIAPVAPAAIESNCNPLRPVSVMHIHGTADPANPPDGSPPRSIFSKESGSPFGKDYKRMTPYQAVEVWKNLDKCSALQTPGYKKGAANCVVYSDCAQESEVQLCMVEGMGHTYPSGWQYFPANIVGPVSYDISFDQIWEFFKKHPMK